MKYIMLLILASLLYCQDCQDSIELLGFGLSKHYDRDREYNERNWGLGLLWAHNIYDKRMDHDAAYTPEFTIVAGSYRDSYNARASFLMPGIRFVWGDRAGWHQWVSVNGGYFMGSGYPGLGIMPSFGAGYSRYDLGVVAGQGMVAGYVKMELARW